MSPKLFIMFFVFSFFVLFAGMGFFESLFADTDKDAAAGNLLFLMFTSMVLPVWIVLFFARRHVAKRMGGPDLGDNWSFSIFDKVILSIWPSVFVVGFLMGPIIS